MLNLLLSLIVAPVVVLYLTPLSLRHGQKLNAVVFRIEKRMPAFLKAHGGLIFILFLLALQTGPAVWLVASAQNQEVASQGFAIACAMSVFWFFVIGDHTKSQIQKYVEGRQKAAREKEERAKEDARKMVLGRGKGKGWPPRKP